MQGVIEGRIVHYVLKSGRSAWQSRPATIVRAWGDGGGEDGKVNLVVALDGSNDADSELANEPSMKIHGGAGLGIVGEVLTTVQLHGWATSVHFDADGAPGTWHWPHAAVPPNVPPDP